MKLNILKIYIDFNMFYSNKVNYMTITIPPPGFSLKHKVPLQRPTVHVHSAVSVL